jgi:hypothetical protein
MTTGRSLRAPAGSSFWWGRRRDPAGPPGAAKDAAAMRDAPAVRDAAAAGGAQRSTLAAITMRMASLVPS